MLFCVIGMALGGFLLWLAAFIPACCGLYGSWKNKKKMVYIYYLLSYAFLVLWVFFWFLVLVAAGVDCQKEEDKNACRAGKKDLPAVVSMFTLSIVLQGVALYVSRQLINLMPDDNPPPVVHYPNIPFPYYAPYPGQPFPPQQVYYGGGGGGGGGGGYAPTMQPMVPSQFSYGYYPGSYYPATNQSFAYYPPAMPPGMEYGKEHNMGAAAAAGGTYVQMPALETYPAHHHHPSSSMEPTTPRTPRV